MKFTALVVTTLVATASVTFAADYQPALRALEEVAPNAAGKPTEDNMQPQPAGADADKEQGVDKKAKEWYGWGRPWGGYGRWGGYGGYGGWGGWGGGWGGLGGWGGGWGW